jgi:TonB family protein
MDASIRRRSIAYSVLIHLGIFLLLLFVVMKTPIPPFPEAGGGGGVLVNIGYLDAAAGDVQPMSEVTTTDPAPEAATSSVQDEESFATQDVEPVPVAKAHKDKPVTQPKTTTKPKTTEKKNPQPVQTVNPQALYKGTTRTGSQGNASSGSGDQGDRNGDISQFLGKGGGSGNGSGSGTGDGEGSGSGPGKGISFDLGGRKMVKSPVIDDRSQETGKVVVAITVDKTGTVISAIPGFRGSTTTSAYLFSKAKEAAMKARFNADPNGADIQKGTITFVFVVQ